VSGVTHILRGLKGYLEPFGATCPKAFVTAVTGGKTPILNRKAFFQVTEDGMWFAESNPNRKLKGGDHGYQECDRRHI
jgi:hypothetical protein